MVYNILSFSGNGNVKSSFQKFLDKYFNFLSKFFRAHTLSEFVEQKESYGVGWHHAKTSLSIYDYFFKQNILKPAFAMLEYILKKLINTISVP